MLDFSVTVFSDREINASAQKPLTPENWNAFVRILNSKVLHLPACYNWMRELNTDPEVFLFDFVTDVVCYITNGSVLGSVFLSKKVLAMVSAMILV